MMRNLLYTGLVLAANALAGGGALAGPVDPALLVGDMGKMVLAEAPKPLPEAGLTDMADGPQSLGSLKGKWVVLNFWATWCAPCREEMPSLQRLQAALPEVAVVTLATGPNPKPAIEKFVDEVGLDGLTMWRDPQAVLARGMGVMGLPVTVVVNPEGAEVARLIGGAEWDGPETLAVLSALMAD